MLQVKVVRHSGFNPRQLSMMQKAVARLGTVLNSDEFRVKVVQFRQPDGRNEFVDNLGLGNQAVYDRILLGAETFPGGEERVADLHLHLVRKPWLRRLWPWDSGLGYGYAGQPDIFTYTDFFGQASEAEYAGHVAHEWCHKLGFDHAERPTPTRPYSVPYQVGTIVEELAERLP